MADNSTQIERPPIVAVMGHIDHGKSTLLDYIRKSNVVEGEAGGITQHISAYEVDHEAKGGTKRITFLDTPGHESFVAMRSRGAAIADIAILVVSAEDGVKEQTLEAKKSIDESGIPFIVAITKTDAPGASVERAQSSLLEKGIYLEKLGGDIPWVPVSAKTGDGIPELLDMVLLVAELQEFTADPSAPASGFVLESFRDAKKGISSTLVIRDGTLTTGSFVVAGSAYSPVRILEDFTGAAIKEASFSSPVRVVGWSDLPTAGTPFTTVAKKKEAEALAKESGAAPATPSVASAAAADDEERATLPLIIKADVAGSAEAIEQELVKLSTDRLAIQIIASSAGSVSENDVKTAQGDPNTVILAFNTNIDAPARDLADRTDVSIERFDIIYKLIEYIEELAAKRTPKREIETVTGTMKVLKTFSKTKDKQVIGGRVQNGELKKGASVRILRRDMEIGRGTIKNLQRQKTDVDEVREGDEFGTEVHSKAEIAPGDIIEATTIVVE